MNDIIIGLSNYYGWLITYCQFVVFEYERFLALEHNYGNLLAPEIIEQCWQYHILNMKHYQDYCIKQFNKIISYKPIYFANSNDRNDKILLTKKYYNKHYGNFFHSMVWIHNVCSRMTKHTTNKKILLYVKNKCIEHIPYVGETILTLRETASKKLNRNIKHLFIFIEGDVNDINSFNLIQIYRLFDQPYENGYGFIKSKPLPDNLMLLDLHNYEFTKLRIYIN